MTPSAVFSTSTYSRQSSSEAFLVPDLVTFNPLSTRAGMTSDRVLLDDQLESWRGRPGRSPCRIFPAISQETAHCLNALLLRRCIAVCDPFLPVKRGSALDRHQAFGALRLTANLGSNTVERGGRRRMPTWRTCLRDPDTLIDELSNSARSEGSTMRAFCEARLCSYLVYTSLDQRDGRKVLLFWRWTIHVENRQSRACLVTSLGLLALGA